MLTTVLFRFDASNTIGLGHAYRCMALIEYLLIHRNVQSIVIARLLPVFLKEKLALFNVQVEMIGDNENELLAIEKLITIYKSQVLILDGYQFDDDYRKSLLVLDVKVICFDDTNSLEKLYCDVVINALPSAHLIGYEKSAREAVHLLGLNYSIVREEFIDSHKKAYSQREKLLINFGGSDVANLTIPLIQLLSENNNFNETKNIIVVTGGAFHQVDKVRYLCEQFGYQHIHNCTEMAVLMAQCKMAICAPGSMVYELSYCGIPSILLTIADNQKLSATAHQSFGWCYVLDGLKKNSVHQAVAYLNELWGNQAKREKMSSIATSINDGLGVKRIINKIEEIIE